MSRIVGIDLGTTNSLVAYVDDKTGLPRVIPDRDGQVLLPSIVSFMREGVLVGAAAKRQLVRRPQSTIYSVKRLMGRGYDDVKDELGYLPFRVLAAEGIVKIQVEGRDTREGATVKPKAPPELLEEMFEIQEALQEAKSAGRSGGLDAAARDSLVTQRDRLRERYDREESRLRGPLSQAWDAAAPAERGAALKAFKESLAVRAYLRTVIDDIDEALGGSQEGYVSHRRH